MKREIAKRIDGRMDAARKIEHGDKVATAASALVRSVAAWSSDASMAKCDDILIWAVALLISYEPLGAVAAHGIPEADRARVDAPFAVRPEPGRLARFRRGRGGRG